jgi:predicted small metal-binding protein
MAYEIACIHAGQEDCEFLIRSENEEEIIEVAMRHGTEAHGYEDLTREDLRDLMYEVD